MAGGAFGGAVGQNKGASYWADSQQRVKPTFSREFGRRKRARSQMATNDFPHSSATPYDPVTAHDERDPTLRPYQSHPAERNGPIFPPPDLSTRRRSVPLSSRARLG